MATDFSKYQTTQSKGAPSTTDFSKYGQTSGQTAQVTQAPQQKSQSLSESIFSSLLDVGVGATKGAVNTLQNVGKWR